MFNLVCDMLILTNMLTRKNQFLIQTEQYLFFITWDLP